MQNLKLAAGFENKVKEGLKKARGDENLGQKKVIRLNISQFELTKILYESEMLAKCDLTPCAKLFLWALCSHFNPKNPTMFPSQQTVAKKLGISEKSAQRAVKELKTAGLIEYETKRVNHYCFGAKFFELVKMSGLVGQNVLDEGGQNVLLTKNNEKSKEKKEEVSKKISNYGKKAAMRGFNQENKVNFYKKKEPSRIPNSEETRKMLQEMERLKPLCISVCDYDEEQARNWLQGMPEFWLKKSKSAKILVKKYGFKEFEFILDKD